MPRSRQPALPADLRRQRFAGRHQNRRHPLDQHDQQRALGLATTLTNQKIPGVGSVSGTPQSVSPDGKVVALQVAFTGQPGDDVVNDAVPMVRDDATAALHGSDLQAGLTGNAAILVDTNHAYDTAERTITIATVIVILVMFGLTFRSAASSSRSSR